MPIVVGVRFKRAGKIYYFAPGEFALQRGDRVIVETARGIEFGEVVIGPREVGENRLVLPLKTVVRPATAEDVRRVEENQAKQKQAFKICQEKIAEHGLPMKLVDVEYTFDNSKIIFYFTAEGRVDFRELVKSLAAIFRTRIELRQIGVRDEAKMIGGIGNCGRVLCCCSFLGDFEPVSIRMAKDQNLALNPNKISGICGRLMCCLKFESDCYEGDSARGAEKFLPREVMPEDAPAEAAEAFLADPDEFDLLEASSDAAEYPCEEALPLQQEEVLPETGQEEPAGEEAPALEEKAVPQKEAEAVSGAVSEEETAGKETAAASLKNEPAEEGAAFASDGNGRPEKRLPDRKPGGKERENKNPPRTGREIKRAGAEKERQPFSGNNNRRDKKRNGAPPREERREPRRPENTADRRNGA